MTKPDLIREFEYKNKQIKVSWFDLIGKDIPDLKWGRVYAIGDLDGLVPVVFYENDDDNLPGGGIEAGETIEQALAREIDEELNMNVISWVPIGYQEWTETDDDSKNSLSLRVYAKLTKKGEFIKDTGGAVIGYKLVPIEKLNEHIKHGNIGNQMVKLIKQIKSNDL